MQNLHYTYDPVGNITHIQDDAQQTVYFANSLVEPSNDYTYDALYRLIEATGRENAAAVAPPRNREDAWPGSGFPSADALRNYTQRYQYDAVGNFVEMRHIVGVGTGWTRHYSNQARQQSARPNLVRQQHARGRHLSYTTPTATCSTSIGVATACAIRTSEWGLRHPLGLARHDLGFDLGGGELARYITTGAASSAHARHHRT